jgi:hypothetical protein
MVTVTARCPYCEQIFRESLPAGGRLDCPHCKKTLSEACPHFDQVDQQDRCVTCPSTELFVRKDFPQRLGVGIVIAGFAASTLAWYYHQVILSYAILFGTALIDVILYLVMGNVLECYRCHAQYRGLASLEGHAAFDLEIHERYRQQAARWKSTTTSSGEASDSTTGPPSRSVR